MEESKPRRLIVNADDFGRSAGINRGIVTSASLMVRWPDAPAAVALAHSHSGLALGLHTSISPMPPSAVPWPWRKCSSCPSRRCPTAGHRARAPRPAAGHCSRP